MSSKLWKLVGFHKRLRRGERKEIRSLGILRTFYVLVFQRLLSQNSRVNLSLDWKEKLRKRKGLVGWVLFLFRDLLIWEESNLRSFLLYCCLQEESSRTALERKPNRGRSFVLNSSGGEWEKTVTRPLPGAFFLSISLTSWFSHFPSSISFYQFQLHSSSRLEICS